MMTGSIQVHPSNLIFSMYNNNPSVPAVPTDRLRAKRCLFGVSDSKVTERLLREEEDKNLKYIAERFQIIDSSCPLDTVGGQVPQSIVAPTVESSRAVLQVRDDSKNASDSKANVIHSDVRSATIEAAASVERPALDNEESVSIVEGASENPSETRKSSAAATSEQSAPGNPSADRPVQRNPGPMRFYGVRRHYIPYARKVEEESRTTGV